MSDEKEHVLIIEESEYYGPDLKLELDCSNQPLGRIVMSGLIHGVEASVEMSFGREQAEQIIAELQGFIDRQEAWKQEIRSRGR